MASGEYPYSVLQNPKRSDPLGALMDADDTLVPPLPSPPAIAVEVGGIPLALMTSNTCIVTGAGLFNVRAIVIGDDGLLTGR